MKKTKHILLISLLALLPTMSWATPAVDQLLQKYRTEGATEFNADRGSQLWHQKQSNGRSCTSCHGMDLTKTGHHEKTGKLIEPMAPSVNPQRFTEVRKIRKWLFRNCKWTLGRQCTPTEKGDLLVWLQQQ